MPEISKNPKPFEKKKTPVIDCPSCGEKFQLDYDLDWVSTGGSGRWIHCPACACSFAIQYGWEITSIHVFPKSFLTNHDV